MSSEHSVNGNIVSQIKGEWWVCREKGEQIAGPFTSETLAREVAAVLQDQPAPPPRRRNT
ncbi:MAG: hypothetical protein Q7U01_10180 [Pseudomonas sp.]|nr:hypothetical protein [Pseudomonas sp.]